MENTTLIIIILLIIILFALIVPFISKNQQLTTRLRSPVTFSTSDPSNNTSNNTSNDFMPTTKATFKQQAIVHDDNETFKSELFELSTLDVIDKERKLLPKDSNILNTPMHNKDLHKNKEAFTNLGLFNNGPDGFSF